MHTYMNAYTHMHKCIPACTHAHTLIHIPQGHSHTHTHTHTHTHLWRLLCLQLHQVWSTSHQVHGRLRGWGDVGSLGGRGGNWRDGGMPGMCDRARHCKELEGEHKRSCDHQPHFTTHTITHTHAHTHAQKKAKQSVPLPLSGHAIRHGRNARALSGPMSQCNATSWSRARTHTRTHTHTHTRTHTHAHTNYARAHTQSISPSHMYSIHTSFHHTNNVIW